MGWVEGNGNSQNEIKYEFTDQNPLRGLNYYRLKQIDFDGKTAYSEVKYVKVGTDEISVYPNPIVDRVHITGITGDANFMIHDINGRILLQGTITDEYIDVSGLMAGSYVLRIVNGGKILHHRVVKVE